MKVKCSVSGDKWYSRDVDWCCDKAEDAWDNNTLQWSTLNDGGHIDMWMRWPNSVEPYTNQKIEYCPWCGEEISRVKATDGEEKLD